MPLFGYRDSAVLRPGLLRHDGGVKTLSKAFRCPKPGDGVTSSATELVERAIVLVFAVLRAGVALQILLAMCFLVGSEGNSPVIFALSGAVVAYSAMLIVVVVRKAAFPVVWGWVDVSIGAAALVACGVLMPRPWLVGSWLNWAPGYLNQVAAFVPAWLRSFGKSVPVGVALGALYLAVALSGNDSQVLAVVENAISFPLFTLAAAVFARYARRVAAMSDENRLTALDMATQLELAQYRFHVHNATGLLATLSRSDISEELMPSFRRQAGEEANRLRNEVLKPHDGSVRASRDNKVRLGAVIWDATSGFGHLPLELPIALGRDALLTNRQALVLEAALIALLYNVQFHAKATEVTIHADRDHDLWEVTVTDNGIGFDVDPDTYGFGLSSQVMDSLQRNDMSATIESRKGEGTCVTIRPSPKN
jgi:hypothetical protein